MHQQADLPFSSSPPVPETSEARLLADILISYLYRNPDWHTARQLAETLDLNDRRIRQLAELSDGRIVSGPGCPGYRHIRHCTPDDIAHAADQLRSQARRMLARSIRLRRRAHALVR